MSKENKTNEYFGMAPMSAEECLEILEKNTHCYGEYLKVKMSLKALEIIKEKPLTLHLIPKCADYDEYLFVVSHLIDASQYEYVYYKEEYDLLKEVLS